MMGFIHPNLKCSKPSRFVELRPGTKVCRLHLGMISTDAVGSKPCPEHRGEVIRGVLVFFRTGCLLSTKVDCLLYTIRYERPSNLKMSTSSRRKLTIRKLARSVARLLFRVYNVQYTYKTKQTAVHLDLRVFRSIFRRPPRSVRCQITTDWSILVDNRLGGSNGLRKNSRPSCTTVSLDFYV